MQGYNLGENIQILCLKVPSFPNGIKEAFNTLRDNLSDINERRYYGISYLDETGKIIYKVAAEAMEEAESKKYGYEAFTIPKGNYLSVAIRDWMTHLVSIGNTFTMLMEDPRMDKGFPCVEWYKDDKEMLCMVKMK